MASLRAELDHAIAERDRLNVVIAYLEERIQDAAAPHVQNGARPGGTRKGKPTAAAAAEQALREAGKPMRTPELLQAVQAMGAQIKDSDGLYKTLSRHDTFRREGRGLWVLA